MSIQKNFIEVFFLIRTFGDFGDGPRAYPQAERIGVYSKP